MEELLPLLHPGSVFSLELQLVPFRGTFDHTLDAKSRLTVPARYRANLAEGVVLAMPLDLKPCVGVWRPSEYDRYTRDQIEALPPLSPKRPDLERFFFGNSLEGELDGAGRVMIPSFLADHASLQREVVVVGAGERMELWNKAAWSGYRPELMTSVAEVTARVDAGT